MQLRSKKSAILAHLGALFTVAVWGSSFVSTKVLLYNGMGPVEIYIYRFVLAYVLLLAFSHSQMRAYSWRDEGIFLLAGLSSGSLYFIAENFALEHTLASNVSLLTSTSPLITTLLVALMYRKMGSGMIVGSVVALLGVCCVIFNSSIGTVGLEINPIGDLLALAAALLWAVYNLLIKRLNPAYDTYFITRKTFFYGIITALPFWLARGDIGNPVAMLHNPAIVGNLLFLGIVASLICFVLWNVGIMRLGAIVTNNYMYLQAVFTMIFSAIVLSEPITLIGVIGCALILLGLWLGDYLSRRQGHAADKL